jgi:hypothetical protein
MAKFILVSPIVERVVMQPQVLHWTSTSRESSREIRGLMALLFTIALRLHSALKMETEDEL